MHAAVNPPAVATAAPHVATSAAVPPTINPTPAVPQRKHGQKQVVSSGTTIGAEYREPSSDETEASVTSPLASSAGARTLDASAS